MTIREAHNILTTYHAWRIGDDEVHMQKPSEVTKAIDTLLKYNIGDVNEMGETVTDCNVSEIPTDHKDKIVKQVIDKFNQRSEVGIKKYGTTLEQNNNDDFFNHLQEELMDAILYIEKLKSIANK
jgi:DNA-binding Lrp family transcriptional regulator